ncbi:PglZ domain-containing protein [Escherichia coli]|uniref:PglZ domain-containing protein n=1 Tax=Escherichia coli TaxID=562 RepID=UPI00200D7DE0|nr:PglZ domain-containing protein [Escherichia coli]MCL0911459.1 PglZ domain-containing protein [Escherichia coli]
MPRQQNFFNEVVKPQFQNPQIKRVFVIISDALRYEVAEELGNQINTEKRFTAELRSQLGVLPSYTQLGMAALLPHEQLCYQPGNGDIVYADGLSTSGNRAEMSPEAAGIAACLMTYSHHACRTENYAMTVHYYRLRDYALQHPECSAIMRIID